MKNKDIIWLETMYIDKTFKILSELNLKLW